ncbi:MAG: creatininase family protein [Caldilineaceae bacterium]|nr:creatininase family protein [Caldilineaceae bacterium]
MKGVRLAELTWEEAADVIETHPIVMLPIGGGTKEHGPHLPCGTDQMVVDELAERVLRESPVLLLPTLPYAYYPAFVDWPGSVSIEANHFKAIVGDIIRSMYRHGSRKFFILDGGVSTHYPLLVLARDLHNELGIDVAVTNILGLGIEVEEEVCEQESGGHADESETSCMLVIRPDLVKMDRAVKEIQPVRPGTRGASGVIKVSIGGKMRTKSGINGDATLATAEKGEKILAAMAQDMITFLEHFAQISLPVEES